MPDLRLYPRLLSNDAQALFDRYSSMLIDDELTAADLSDHAGPATDDCIFASTGPQHVSEDELRELRYAVVELARQCGFPGESPTTASRVSFDRRARRALLERTGLFPAEAAVYEVWSFVALRLLPDVAFWRWPAAAIREGSGDLRHNRERFVGVDLTRHAFGRLWWTGLLATARASDRTKPFEWIEIIGEADLDQIFTRRDAYGASPEAFRSILRCWAQAIGPGGILEGARDRRLVHRDALKRLLRRGAFVRYDLLEEAELDETVRELYREAMEELEQTSTKAREPSDGERVAEDGDTAAETDGEAAATAPRRAHEDDIPSAQVDGPGRSIDDVPFKDWVVLVSTAVRERGELPDDELVAEIRRGANLDITGRRAKWLQRMAWVAAGLEMLKRDEDISGWRLGEAPIAPDRRWRSWTMTELVARAGELVEELDEPYDTLVEEFFDGRPSRLAGTIAHTAVYEAQNGAGGG